MRKPTLFAALFGIGLSAALLIGEGVNVQRQPMIAPDALWALSPMMPGTPPSDVPAFGVWTPEGR